MLRDGGNILLIRADDQQYLPYGKCAALDTGLPAGGGVTEINEGEFRTSEPFLNQTCAGIARRLPWRVAMRLRRFPLAGGNRILITTDRVVPMNSSRKR